ncbi:MAG: hypothetical protein ABEK02_08025 [Haloquadratum sp.]
MRSTQANAAEAAPTTDPRETALADETAPSEDVYVRNYDPFRGYDLAIRVGPPDDPVFEETYYLTPGRTASLEDRIEPGEYAVAVELDSGRQKTARCRVGPAPADTIHVELGNGVVSVTEGLFE